MCLQGHFNKVQLKKLSLCQGGALLSTSTLESHVVRALHEGQPTLIHCRRPCAPLRELPEHKLTPQRQGGRRTEEALHVYGHGA